MSNAISGIYSVMQALAALVGLGLVIIATTTKNQETERRALLWAILFWVLAR